MSVANIVSMIPIPGGELLVRFSCKDGIVRSYTYDGDAAAKIAAGADPSLFTPTGSSEYGG
jgi:hypothetical protein